MFAAAAMSARDISFTSRVEISSSVLSMIFLRVSVFKVAANLRLPIIDMITHRARICQTIIFYKQVLILTDFML